ncbi:MAG: RICIN domain-containing protein [Eggerthellaceae bacterium]|nr:RICIN domain-containing protein [Eggerthellaceae bacterium]
MQPATKRIHIACFLLIASLLASAFVCTTSAAEAHAAPASGTQAVTTEVALSDNVTPVKPGIYYIQSCIRKSFVLDVSGGSKSDRANVQIYHANSSDAQKWRVSVDANGTYSIRNVKSGKYLDVSGGTARNSQNVWQYTGNNSKAQQWQIKKDGKGFVIASGINKNYVLDVEGANAANGTNVHLYRANGTAAQRWWFIPVAPSLESEKTLENGLYEIQFAKNKNFVIDLAGANTQNRTNIRLWGRNSTQAQKWIIKRESDGFYSVKNILSDKVLDVANGNPVARANVWSYNNNGTDAQRWAIVKNKNGTYTFVNKKSGMALEAAGGKAAKGTNIQTYLADFSGGQQFTLTEASPLYEGIFVIESLLSSNYVLDIKSASKNAGAATQLWTKNGSVAQIFQLRQVKEDIFQIQSAVSGLYLQDSGGKVTQQKRSANNKAQQWTGQYLNGAVVFTNVSTGKRLAVSGGTASKGARMVTAKAANTNAQCFKLKSTTLPISEGYYFVKHSSGKVLDVAGASFSDCANIQVYNLNNTAAQKFNFIKTGGEYFRLISDNSGKAVDVSGASMANGANVWQYSYNGTDAQLWKVELALDGGYVLVNKGSGKALDLSGTNVIQNTKTGAASQRWSLSATSSSGISGNAELDYYIREIVALNNGDLARCFNWVVRNIHWTNSVAGEVLPYGIISNERSIDYALYAFRNHRGDCYYHASIFKWLARGCGYAAEARAGGVPSASQGIAAHGWTEVYVNGGTYICDANLAQDIGGGYNWYMTTYYSAPVQYYL